MGCHTWFHKKIEVTEKNVKKDVIIFLKKEIDFYNQLINNRDKIDEDLLNVYPEWTKEFGLYHKPIYERRLRMIEKNLCKLAMYNKYKNSDYINIHQFDKSNNTMYVTNHDLPHDIFRISGYPLIFLYSLKETMKFIKDNNDKVYYTHRFDQIDKIEIKKLKNKSIERLKKFWNDYPNGMINFG